MRKIILLFFTIVIATSIANAQVVDGTPNDSTVIIFHNDSIANYIPDTAAMPLWQIGRTHKPFFTTDSAGAFAIMTDTLTPYPANANNWFIIKVPHTWNVIIDFWHKYQTDNSHAGGIVEFSTDTGITWQNVKGACNEDSSFSGFSGVLTTNFYSFIDTLVTGAPSFTGSSSLEYSRFQFFDGFPVSPHNRITSGTGCNFETVDTFYIRFRFVSDTITDSLAGWEIDSIKIEDNIYCCGGITNINKPQTLHINPNPSYDGIFTLPPLDDQQEYTTQVYNVMGQRVINSVYNQFLNLSLYAKGIYFYKITNGTNYYSGQLLVE